MAHMMTDTTTIAIRASIAAIVLLFSASAQAQTGTPTSRLAWDQGAPDLATAQAYAYTYYADGATTGTALTGVTCTGTAAPFTCSAAFPAFTPGNHTLTLTAKNVAGEGPKSSPLSFVFVVLPSAPQNVRIQ